MPFASDIRYLYDGSFEGFLSCVFDAVYSRTVPVDICEQSIAQPSFYQDVWVSTDLEHAQRVYDSIPKKICPDAAELVRDAFCSCVPQKELLIFRFLIFGYRYGKQVYYMRSHARVAPLYEAQRHLHNEAHLLQGFVRFTDTGRALVAKITPKNFVLPYLAPHFCERYAIPTEQCVCFGDSLNDLAVFRVCPNSVAMKHSPEELRQCATYIAGGEIGVAEGVAHYFGKIWT